MMHRNNIDYASRRAPTIGLAAGLAAAVAAVGLVFAAPASADVDTDFSDQLRAYGIYGSRDYNAWIAKITCERLEHGIDADADGSAGFVSDNLPRGSTTAQAWQFLAAAVGNYCPDRAAVLRRAAERQR